MNEPMSMLQRMSEQMEYADCLDNAAKCDDPCLRMAYVMGFGVSTYNSTIGRTK
jgi:hypothetical protein